MKAYKFGYAELGEVYEIEAKSSEEALNKLQKSFGKKWMSNFKLISNMEVFCKEVQELNK